MLEIENGSARLTIDRPPLNILDFSSLLEMAQATVPLKNNRDISLFIITGSGTKAFSAGVDVKDHTPDKVAQTLHEFHKLVMQICELPFPTLAVVRGLCLGGGMELAMACDLVLAEEGAKFGQPEIHLGCFPPVACALLPELIGKKKASEIVLLGNSITASEACSMGIVNKVVASDKLEETAEEWRKQLLEKSPPVLRLAKDALNYHPGATFPEALLRAEKIYLDQLMKTNDAIEGIEAFLQKRKPVWKGC